MPMWVGGEAVGEGAAGVNPCVPVLFRSIDCRSTHEEKLLGGWECLKLFVDFGKY